MSPKESKRSNRLPLLAMTSVAALAFLSLVSTQVAHAQTISGIVYDSATATPITGAVIELRYDEQDSQQAGELIDASNLAAGQQRQASNTTGEYRFDLTGIAPGRLLQIRIDTSASNFSFPSVLTPPRPGTAAIGAVVSTATPAENPADRRYHTRFVFADSTDVVSNNHIPLESASQLIELSVAPSQPRASVGDVVTYRLTIRNRSNRDFTASSGRPAFIEEAPARGFDFVADTAAVAIRGSQTKRALASRLGSAGNRLVRLGPFDLASGATVDIEFRVVVGVNTRPGRRNSLSTVLDSGGVRLSGEQQATVEVDVQSVFDSSTVIGRVFCDDDDDGRIDSGESGVFGARVYWASGSYVIADQAGAFHFSRVPAGTQLFKIDTASLPGSKLLGKPTRLVRLSSGLPAKINFPVRCGYETIRGKDPQVTITHPKRGRPVPDPRIDRPLGSDRLTIEGELLLLSVKLGDREIELPTAVARISGQASVLVPSPTSSDGGGINLIGVPPGGYGQIKPRFELGFNAPKSIAAANPRASRWTFVIAPSGSNRAEPFFKISGNGAPPAAIDWDGRGSDGTTAKSDSLYVAQLVVIGSEAKIEAASPLVPFGIAYGGLAKGPSRTVWAGGLFTGDRTSSPTSKLEQRVKETVATLAPGDSIAIEAHAKDAKSRISALAATQRRADAVKSLFEKAGVATDRITASGRGGAEPSPTAATGNRRVVVIVTRAKTQNLGKKVPLNVSVPSSALIDGQPTTTDDRGHFIWQGAVPARKKLLIDVQAQDGRRAAIELDFASTEFVSAEAGGEKPPILEETVNVKVEADLTKRSVLVEGRPLDPALLGLSLRIVADGKAIESIVLPTTVPKISLGPESDLTGQRAEVVIRDERGSEVARLPIKADDALVWPATARFGPAGEPRTYVAQLIVERANGARGYSPKRIIAFGQPAPTQRASSPQFLVNGVVWPITSGKATGHQRITAGGALLVDVTTADGAQAIYVTMHSAIEATINANTKLGSAEVAELGATRLAANFRNAGAAEFVVTLPPADAVLPAEVAIRGTSRIGNRITINGKPVLLDSRGKFAFILTPPVGSSELIIRSEDPKGFVATLKRSIQVSRSEAFGMALAELTVGTAATERGLLSDNAMLPGDSPATSVALGPVVVSGKANVFLKGSQHTDTFFKKVGFAVRLDTGKRRETSAFFDDVADPVRSDPAVGDSAIEVRDTPGRGKLYLRLTADKSEVVVGALAAEIGRGTLFHHGRTVDGVGANLEADLGAAVVEVDAYATTQKTDSQRDHVWYRSTGGTLYYLRFANVLVGSETIRVVVKERDSGLVVRETKLRRNTDYTVDYQSGRIWLLAPVASTEARRALLSDRGASLTPTDGDPIFIEARYEHADARAGGERSAGGEGRLTIADQVTVGGGAVGESRKGSKGYSLFGGFVRYRTGEKSHVEAELATSKEREGDVEISVDGGLSFRDLGASAALENPNGERGYGWRASGTLGGGDISKALKSVTLSAYAQGVDREFSSTGAELQRGRTKFGADATVMLGKRDQLVFRHRAEIAKLPQIGPSALDVATATDALDERASVLSAIGWIGERGPFTHQVELGHQRISSTASRADGASVVDARRYGVAGRTQARLNDVLKVSLFQEVWGATRNSDPIFHPLDPPDLSQRKDEPLAGVTTGLGASWLVLKETALLADLRQRWNGDQAATIGLKSKLSEHGSFYIAERAIRTGSGPTAVTVIGAEDRFGPNLGSRSYGEYQIENVSSSARNRAVLGVGHRWRPIEGLGLGLGFEHQQVFGGFLPDGTAIGNNQRDLIRAALDVEKSETFRIGVSVELRADRGTSDDDNVDRDLLDNDPRDPTGNGFPDHGGTAPGIPLVLPGGELTQFVGMVGFVWQPQEGVSVVTRARASRAWSSDQSRVADDVGFAELTTGLAYRSLVDDRLALLLRYSLLRERRPDALSQDELSQAHILALVPVADLTNDLRLSAKLAWKLSSASGGLSGIAREQEVSQWATLALLRLGYKVLGNWDLTAEGRSLVVGGESSELLLGTLAEVGYNFDKFVRFGAGYNFSHFNDNEFGDLTRDAHGFFIRLTAEL